jgi:hypothetical protein
MANHTGMCGAALMLLTACGASEKGPAPLPSSGDAAMAPIDLAFERAADAGPAPTYTKLFTQLFARGTPGHCATVGCHEDPGHNVFLCATRDGCYTGMVQAGLIDPVHPERSTIGDPTQSPLSWINPADGNMPIDAPGPNPAGREAILEWVAAGAQNN